MQEEEEGDWSLLHVVAWDGDLDKARPLLEVGHNTTYTEGELVPKERGAGPMRIGVVARREG